MTHEKTFLGWGPNVYVEKTDLLFCPLRSKSMKASCLRLNFFAYTVSLTIVFLELVYLQLELQCLQLEGFCLQLQLSCLQWESASNKQPNRL